MRLIFKLVLNAYVQKRFISAYSGASIGSRGLNIGLNHLLHPYLVYASSEDSGETAHLHMLA